MGSSVLGWSSVVCRKKKEKEVGEMLILHCWLKCMMALAGAYARREWMRERERD